MKSLIRKFGLSLVSAMALTALLTACGDENTTEVTEQTGVAMLEAGKSMPECNSESAGDMVYAADSAAVYYCAEGKWQTLNGKDGAKGDKGEDGAAGAKGENGANGKTPEAKDGESCSAKANEDGKSYTISCPGSEDIVIRNGEDGKSAHELSGYEGSVADWIASLKGEAGKNCTIEDVKEGEKVIGYNVTCDDVSKTIQNGTDGKDGVGCTAKDLGDGNVEVTCGDGESKTVVTMFKASCGSESFEPTKAFCFEGEIYSCDDKPYNPAKQYCLTLKDGEGAEKSIIEELLIDNRDKNNVQAYKTVKICDDNDENCQTWMAENLNYAYTGVKFNYGGHTSDSTSWCYDNEVSNCEKYGRLYTWAAAVDSVAIRKKYGEDCGYNKSCARFFSASALAKEPVQGVCPQGWHLPSDAEWSALYMNVGGSSSAGQKLKANTSQWASNTGSDEYGFSILPAGSRTYDGKFSRAGDDAIFWSATEYEGGNIALIQYFTSNLDKVVSYSEGKPTGFSVRCLKD